MKCLLSALLEIPRLSQAYQYSCLTHLAPFCGIIRKLACLLFNRSCTRPSADGLSFAFPKMTLKLKCVIFLWPEDWSFVYMRSLPAFQSLLLPLPLGKCTRSQPQGGLHVSEGFGALGSPVSQLWGSMGKAFCVTHRMASRWNQCHGQQCPHHFDAPMSILSSALPTTCPTWAIQLMIQYCGQGKRDMSPLVASGILGKVGAHSLAFIFPHRRNGQGNPSWL